MNNKDKIMEAATELFHIYGYDGTSIDMLIKKAGVSKSNFYYYFEAKEELGLEILTKLADSQVSEFSKIMQTDLNPVEQLLECYKRLVSSHRDLLSQPIYPGSFFGNMALEQSSINEKFRFVLDKYFRECETLLEGHLRKGVEQGCFNEDIDPPALATLIVCQFEGAILMAKTKKSMYPIEEAMRESRRLIIKEEWWHLLEGL